MNLFSWQSSLSIAIWSSNVIIQLHLLVISNSYQKDLHSMTNSFDYELDNSRLLLQALHPYWRRRKLWDRRCTRLLCQPLPVARSAPSYDRDRALSILYTFFWMVPRFIVVLAEWLILCCELPCWRSLWPLMSSNYQILQIEPITMAKRAFEFVHFWLRSYQVWFHHSNIKLSCPSV